MPPTERQPTPASFEQGTVPIQHSGWLPPGPHPHFAPLQQDFQTDVVVVGAGLAGTSLALHLAQQGVTTVLLEAQQPGCGASGRNAGHVQPFLENLKALQHWPDQGRAFAELFMQHRNIVFDLCQRFGIADTAQASGMLDVAYKKHPAMQRKATHWRAQGYEVEEVGGQELERLTGSPLYHHGLHWHEGGQVNPYLFTQGMARAAQQLGAHVHGDTPVLACDRAGDRWRVLTPHGSVHAAQVVVCTNGHWDNPFFPELTQTHYPLVACALATQPLPAELRASFNPSRAALTQYPTGLYPMVIDARHRLITATIPRPGQAAHGDVYFQALLRHLHKHYPATREHRIELQTYWTGRTANSSHVYHADYPCLYQVADGVLALVNLGTWGNIMGPVLGMNLAQALAQQRLQDLVLPIQPPTRVRFPWLFELKVKRLMMPAARWVDRLGLA